MGAARLWAGRSSTTRWSGTGWPTSRPSSESPGPSSTSASRATSPARSRPTEASMAKLWVTEMQGRLVDQCVQFHGGLRLHARIRGLPAVRRCPGAADLWRHVRDHARTDRAGSLSLQPAPPEGVREPWRDSIANGPPRYAGGSRHRGWRRSRRGCGPPRRCPLRKPRQRALPLAEHRHRRALAVAMRRLEPLRPARGDGPRRGGGVETCPDRARQRPRPPRPRRRARGSRRRAPGAPARRRRRAWRAAPLLRFLRS